MIINYAKIIEQLEQIRKALIVSGAAVLLVTTVLYFKADILIYFLAAPLGQRELVFLTPMEGLITRVKIASFTALAFCQPVIFWQFIRAASRFMTDRQRKVLYWAIPVVMLLFAGGVYFGFKVVIPVTLQFLLETGQQFMTATLSGNRYFSFILMLSLALGVVFQLPLVMAVLAVMGIINSSMLRQKRKGVILAILVVVALITPTPDPVTLTVISLPLLGLYELTIWLILVYEKFSTRKNKIPDFQEV
jgi:sec-independent protein translocase protein TatC